MAQLLVSWRAEARRRARSLGAPVVLALDPEIGEVARRLDRDGGLLATLHCVCAKAVAEVASRHLVRGSRLLADRTRRERAEKR